MIDRVEELAGSRTTLCGYLRGNNLNVKEPLFISGFGLISDYTAEQITDPCPLLVYDPKSRSLRKKEKMIHAPQSQVGQCIFDKDGDYITLPKQHVVFTQVENEEKFLSQNKGVQMMREMQSGKHMLDS